MDHGQLNISTPTIPSVEIALKQLKMNTDVKIKKMGGEGTGNGSSLVELLNRAPMQVFEYTVASRCKAAALQMQIYTHCENKVNTRGVILL